MQPGDELVYTVLLQNIGNVDQPDNAGLEFRNLLQQQKLELVSVQASSGQVEAVLARNMVRWNGAIPSGNQIELIISARVKPDTSGGICNRGVAFYDADRDGVNESRIFTDDPRTPAVGDRTCVRIGQGVSR